VSDIAGSEMKKSVDTFSADDVIGTSFVAAFINSTQLTEKITGISSLKVTCLPLAQRKMPFLIR